jgi:hypothetical protein
VISLLAQLAIALLFATAYSRDRRDRTIIALLQMLFLLISLEMSFSADPHASQALKARLTLRSAIRQLPTYLHPDQTRIALASAGDVNLAGLRLDERFHRIIGSGTVESVPWDVVSVRANGWNWSPRPVFQTYQACRPSLDLLNAEHLQSRRAADFIVLGWGEIDGRHQFLSDPGSWRAMLDWYDLALATDDHLLLRRRSTPRFGTPHEIGHTTARWNEEIMIPQDDQLLMSVEIRRSVRGVLASLLFGNAPVYASVSYRSGQKERWRAVAANLAAGFPISALPRNLSALALLWDGKAPVDLAATIRFESDQVSEYGDTLVIHWRQLPGRTEQ